MNSMPLFFLLALSACRTPTISEALGPVLEAEGMIAMRVPSSELGVGSLCVIDESGRLKSLNSPRSLPFLDASGALYHESAYELPASKFRTSMNSLFELGIKLLRADASATNALEVYVEPGPCIKHWMDLLELQRMLRDPALPTQLAADLEKPGRYIVLSAVTTKDLLIRVDSTGDANVGLSVTGMQPGKLSIHSVSGDNQVLRIESECTIGVTIEKVERVKELGNGAFQLRLTKFEDLHESERARLEAALKRAGWSGW